MFYRTSGQGGLQVLSTNRTSAELRLPAQEGYVVHVRATTAGGDGASSAPIRIPRRTRKGPGRTPPPPHPPPGTQGPSVCPLLPHSLCMHGVLRKFGGVRGEAGGTKSCTPRGRMRQEDRKTGRNME